MVGKIEKNSYILFFLANSLILLNPGAFWDDWTLYNMDDKGILNQFIGNGSLVFGYLHIFLKNLWISPILYRILTLLLQATSIFILFRILAYFQLSNRAKKMLAFSILIYATFPVYDSKVTMIVLPYTICVTLFLIASFFLLKYTRKERKIGFRVLSLILFFISFFTNSLLFFYLLPIFFILFYSYWIKLFERKEKLNYRIFIKSIFHKVLIYIDFFALPFIFWIIRSQFFLPSQQYESIGYNIVNLESLLEIPYRIVIFLYVSVVDIVPIILEAIKHFEIWIFLIFAGLIIYRQLLKLRLDFRVSCRFIIWGFIILILGAFPYLMVNKYPSYLDYLSRHQLLIGFGASLVFSGAIFLLKSEFLKRIILSICLSGFMAITIFLHFSYFKGYVKQQVFTSYFFSEPHFPSETPETIILHDHTENFTQKGNPTKFYAFAGMMKLHYPNQNSLLARPEDWKGYLEVDLFPKIAPYYFQYNLSNYNFTKPAHSLEVNYAKERPTFPIWTYYSDFIKGNQKSWNNYFKFELKPTKSDNSFSK